MRKINEFINEKLKVNPSKQRLESLEDFDFDMFFNSLDDFGQLNVSSYLKASEPIIDEYLPSRTYILDHIGKLKFRGENSIMFVFTLKSDPQQTRTWRKSNKEQIEIGRYYRLKNGVGNFKVTA